MSLPAPPFIVSMPGAAVQRVVAVAAGQRVVAVAAVERDLDETGETGVGGEGVVAAERIDHEVLGRADVHHDVAEVARERDAAGVRRGRP